MKSSEPVLSYASFFITYHSFESRKLYVAYSSISVLSKKIKPTLKEWAVAFIKDSPMSVLKAISKSSECC